MANLSQRLKHGKALCGKVFAGFVETFNALVDFKDNLKGDDDVAQGAGHIRVDRKNKSHPIIRCKGCENSGDRKTKGRYEFTVIAEETEEGESQTYTLEFSNTYYSCAGQTFEGAQTELENISLPAFVALKICITEATPTDELVTYTSLSDLQSAQSDEDYYIAPLYKIDGTGNIECDFRIGPDAAQWEFGDSV